MPAAVRCRACGATTEQDGFPLACGVCAGLQVDVVAGGELRLDALEVEYDDELTTIGRTEP